MNIYQFGGVCVFFFSFVKCGLLQYLFITYSVGVCAYLALVGSAPFVEYKNGSGVRCSTAVGGLGVQHEDAIQELPDHVGEVGIVVQVVDKNTKSLLEL